MFLNPTGKLYRSDVFALAMVGAALRDQDHVPVLQIVKRLCAVDDCFQISFVSRKQDRERGQWNVRRNDRCHFRENLAVGHDEGNLVVKPPKHVGKLGVSDDNGGGSGVKKIPDRLLLGQDQSAFRGGGIDRNDEQYETSRCDQIADDAPEWDSFGTIAAIRSFNSSI